ncbi:MAG: AraC family transcriptional regulator [Advenella sp.]|uniref:AraC family transcriptional regulator n=1 Tax=Advenella kashmirensis TaxID=310575 RepID=A0A356LL67_9BURK|nr:AraC family transcriptional regulator [Advenella kashmirensis]
MSQIDWLSRLLQLITVTGQLDVRCVYSAPWRMNEAASAAYEIPYHVILHGRAIIEDPETETAQELVSGDIVLLPHGSAHILHDGSGKKPRMAHDRQGSAGWMLSENDGRGERLDMLCGRFRITPPHDRLIHNYLPRHLVVRVIDTKDDASIGAAARHLSSLVDLMRMEADGEKVGGYAILNALSSALFTLTLRAASESEQAPVGLLALTSYPRLAPAISAMFSDPQKNWNLQNLADLCNMSRATFMRHFQDKLGYSAFELLVDIRMSLAANQLKKPNMTTEAVAELVGYQSISAFRRVFTDKIGMTPGQWRRQEQPDSTQ